MIMTVFYKLSWCINMRNCLKYYLVYYYTEKEWLLENNNTPLYGGNEVEATVVSHFVRLCGTAQNNNRKS